MNRKADRSHVPEPSHTSEGVKRVWSPHLQGVPLQLARACVEQLEWPSVCVVALQHEWSSVSLTDPLLVAPVHVDDTEPAEESWVQFSGCVARHYDCALAHVVSAWCTVVRTSTVLKFSRVAAVVAMCRAALAGAAQAQPVLHALSDEGETKKKKQKRRSKAYQCGCPP